ncbi:MAG: GNAT family N-acetyltransferase [Rhizobiaceae bacterium]
MRTTLSGYHNQMDNFEIRKASPDEFVTAIKWAHSEGWNPGHDDLAPFFTADSSGFLMGYLQGIPISSISVVRYGEDFGFLGFYIVHPNYRGMGYGLATWNAGMSLLEGRTIGLDGVVEQQDNYKKSGFDFAHRTIRYAGQPEIDPDEKHPYEINRVADIYMDEIHELDGKCFPAVRSEFLRHWLLPDEQTQRHSFAAIKNGELAGFATIRKCHEGYKIGPLFALSQDAAGSLFVECCAIAEPDATVVIDVPEANAEGANMAKSFGLSPVFETARMYRGETPPMQTPFIFGSTTLELG